jgi:16S rRNA (guanine966-N2)-methyltransferase|tara:strand:+ start:3271 stop:3834 length:564 start_codon:yes stop_codon:yes gene_type:complete
MESKIRIIAGKWRGRKIKFAASEAVRPTPDRVRETLFNWLQNITNANCLDLFAGSGALGIESLSRGARSVTFIDESKECCNNIAQTIALIDHNLHPQIHNMSFAMSINALKNKQFDVIFLDPPYNTELLEQACKMIISNKLLMPNGFIYCETASKMDINYPKEMQIEKTKTYGNVTFSLFKIAKEAT